MKPPVSFRRTDYDRRLLPNAHLRSLEEGVSTQPDWVARSGYSVGYPAWGLLYYAALCRLRPGAFNLVIETGANLGCSTIILGQALRDSGVPGRVHTVEIDPGFHARAVENIRLAGLDDLVRVHLGDSLSLLPRMLAQEPQAQAQVVFLDGSHLLQHVVGEFELVLPRLAADGIVIFDNTANRAELGDDSRVHGAIRLILQRHAGGLVNFPHCSWSTPGMAIWQRTPFPA